MNPAVSLVAAARRRAAAGATPPPISSSQLAFGILGAWAAHLMFDLPTLQLSVKARTGLGQWTGEAIATFGLILTILGTVRHRPRMGAGERRALHRRGLLVHLLDQLRQPRDHRRAQPLRQLRRDRARTTCRRSSSRSCSAPRRPRSLRAGCSTDLELLRRFRRRSRGAGPIAARRRRRLRRCGSDSSCRTG